METRENRTDSGSLIQNEKKDESTNIPAAISNFAQKIRRIDTREIELPSKKDNFLEQKSRELDESIIISRMQDEGSQPSHKGFKGNSDGTNPISSNIGASSNKLLNITGGNLGGNHSNQSNNKSPSIGTSVSVGEPDLEGLPESTLKSLLQTSLQNKTALEMQVHKLDRKIWTLQRSILEKSRASQLPRDDHSDRSEGKTAPRLTLSALKPGKRVGLDSKLVQEVFNESPSLVNRSSLMWQHLDSLMNDTSTVKPEPKITSFPNRPGNCIFQSNRDPPKPRVKKRDLIIKSTRDNKHINRTFTYQAATSVTSERPRVEPKYKLPSDQIRSFSINSNKKPLSNAFKREGPKRAQKSFTIDDSYIFQ